VGPARATGALAEYTRERSAAAADGTADAELVNHVETVLAGSIGTASARVMVATVVEEEPLGIDEVMEILDETSQAIAYSRELERKSQELEAATAELRAANERLQELDRLKDDFVSTVTHELLTPLTSMRAFSEILLSNPELPAPERERYRRLVIEEIDRLTRLIHQVLDLSKLESGRAEWNIASVDLREVVEDSVAATAELFKEREANLELRLPEAVPAVAADRDRVKQVMLNLLSNAAKFCDTDRGRVQVELGSEDGALRVDVRDNGPGIPLEQQKVIFERFRRGDEMTDRSQGTGLGLSISSGIISHLGGELWVQSAPGRGATFSFKLPLAGAPTASLEN
ncbi:MAG: sensor histidine kinase, partial [Solirubrobacterales bacterium]